MALPKPTIRLASRAALKRIAILFSLIALFLVYCYFAMIVMPGTSYRGQLPPATDAQKQIATQLESDITILADATGGVGRVGNRSTFYPKRFATAAAWLHDQLTAAGYTQINEIPVARGSPVPNLEVIVPGTSKPAEIVVIGAHYDAFQGTPGADDNASGTAACLHLARIFKNAPQSRTLRFVFFVNEEPPTFWTPDMGSWVYAKKCRDSDDDITAMLSLESIGFYSTASGSQHYPQPLNQLYPDTADFIAFVSNYSSRSLNRRALASFRTHAKFPSEGASPFSIIPGVGNSDQWSFWQEGYRGIMITDTANYRNPNYHTPTDKPDTLDYDRMSRVVQGLEEVIKDLASDRDR
jgi:Zn-dependent M28 family amino/carboxypeptidase